MQTYWCLAGLVSCAEMVVFYILHTYANQQDQPALVITGECDVLPDEGEAYEHNLAEAGVQLTAVRYLGIIHEFVMLHALAKTMAAPSAVDLTTDKLRKTSSKLSEPFITSLTTS